MRKTISLCGLICVAGLCAGVTAQDKLVTSAQVRQVFADPPREYSSGPLWVWNDRLTPEQIVSTLQDMAGQHVRQVFVHPRPGLMTPYLSDEWFDLWRVALKEAERLDMNVWIYDENSYPSGFAGGFVPRLMPEARGRGLIMRDTETPKWQAGTLAVFRLENGESQNVSQAVKAGEAVAPGQYLVAEIRRADNKAWNAGGPYVDLLYPGVTEKFLEVTLEAYRREVGDQFGKRVPGSFTDEPELQPAGGWPWTEDLPEQFEKQWGYSLIDHLSSLTREVGDWRTVRHNYFQTVLTLFIERWAKPYYEYCEKHDLEFTGHYWEHGWPGALGVPDNMAMAAWQQRPGIDTLMNQYAENTHAQFGNIRACREISSLANQLGRDRTLVELYGAGGWDLRFEDMKRIGDWLEVLGVNTLNEHLSYITLRGARKRDHPQSFSYHEPWWTDYHVIADYFTRVTAAMTQGEQVNRILVLEPTTTAWMYQGNARLNTIGDTFFDLLKRLEAAQVEYDLGCENTMADHGSVRGKELVIGQRSYPVVVLPSAVENLDNSTFRLLEQFVRAGGTVYRVLQGNTEKWPTFIEGKPSGQARSLAQESNWRTLQAGNAASVLSGLDAEDHFAIRRAEGDTGILFHHRRLLADGQILFLVNTSDTASSSGTIESDMKGIEQWDLTAGHAIPYRFDKTVAGVKARFTLQPCESLLLFLSEQACESKPAVTETAVQVAASGTVAVRRSHPNVLTLDYVNITAGGETRENVYVYQANQFAFRKNGLDRNPWDSAVQYKDELITRTFPPGSGFTATYAFTIETTVPENLAIVIERPDLYRITCNGEPVVWDKTLWWLDKAFGKMAIADLAKTGRNTVTLQASPFTMYHELESAYVLGDFSLKNTSQGFVIASDASLTVAPNGWNEQGHPFYSAGVVYTQVFDVTRPVGRYEVSVPAWYGSTARVSINGQTAGRLVARPWTCEVTNFIKAGRNRIQVEVIGTLKNTLGPHHGKPGLGTAWPSMFHNGPEPGPPPGSQYHTVAYGLFEPFTLIQIKPK
ncbi:MAG: hypothetical protein K9N55_05085 [Phycisphaerae bacterium]|nr:hypothetical protein [Phycisphaerae bacterium]